MTLLFDCFFGIGTASLTFMICKLYESYGYLIVTVFWSVIIKMVGYDYVLFHRMDVEYLYEKNLSPALDVFFSICVAISNFLAASRLFSHKLIICETCSKQFQQYISISEYTCVCVCQQDCKRLAKYCDKCKSANLTIRVAENISKYKILLMIPFIEIMGQHLDFIFVHGVTRIISGLLFFYVIIRLIITICKNLKSVAPPLSLPNITSQTDENESPNKLLLEMKEMIESQQDEHSKRTKKLLQQQMNENERQDNIEKKINNHKQTMDEQFEELRSQCIDIRTKIDNQEKQQELLLKLILDLSKEDLANGESSS